MHALIDTFTAILLLAGSGFVLVAGIGILRMPDIMIRMHASTKAGTMGTGLILSAVALHFGEPGVVSRAIAVIAFLLLTAPVAAHMIGRAAYRTGVPLWGKTIIDEFGRPPNPNTDNTKETTHAATGNHPRQTGREKTH